MVLVITVDIFCLDIDDRKNDHRCYLDSNSQPHCMQRLPTRCPSRRCHSWRCHSHRQLPFIYLGRGGIGTQLSGLEAVTSANAAET